ncbi:MAG: NAD(P)-binding domain-containing protein [Gemmatimonadota bacterium]
MRIGIIGSGVVGQTLGAKLAERSHDVVLGTRNPANTGEKRGYGASLGEWVKATGNRAKVGTFADAAAHGEVVINASKGDAAVAALELAGRDHLAGKILIDVGNPLDFSKGMPPTLTVCNTDSLGEQIQRVFPDVKVVKTLNTVNCDVMVDPGRVANGDHHLFVSGNDASAKQQVIAWLKDWFGWKEIIDLGDITTARGTEMVLPLWIRLMGALGTPFFNYKVVR